MNRTDSVKIAVQIVREQGGEWLVWQDSAEDWHVRKMQGPEELVPGRRSILITDRVAGLWWGHIELMLQLTDVPILRYLANNPDAPQQTIVVKRAQ